MTSAYLFRPGLGKVPWNFALPQITDALHTLHFCAKRTEQLEQDNTQTVHIRLWKFKHKIIVIIKIYSAQICHIHRNIQMHIIKYIK